MHRIHFDFHSFQIESDTEVWKKYVLYKVDWLKNRTTIDSRWLQRNFIFPNFRKIFLRTFGKKLKIFRKFGKFSENIFRKFGKHIFRTFGKVDDIPLNQTGQAVNQQENDLYRT